MKWCQKWSIILLIIIASLLFFITFNYINNLYSALQYYYFIWFTFVYYWKKINRIQTFSSLIMKKMLKLCRKYNKSIHNDSQLYRLWFWKTITKLISSAYLTIVFSTNLRYLLCSIWLLFSIKNTFKYLQTSW